MNTRYRFLIALVPVFIAGPAAAMTVPALADAAAPIIASSQPLAGAGIETVAANNGAAAQSFVTNLGDAAMAAIADKSTSAEAKKQTFRTLLNKDFDMATIGRFALGRFWRTATPQQQTQYLDLYQKMIVDVYTARFSKYSGQVFKVTGNRVDESGDVIVNSVVSGSGDVSVDWRVRPKGGTYRIVDVMVEGISMAVTQRNDFAGVIQRGGGDIQSLLDYLKQGGTSDVKG